MSRVARLAGAAALVAIGLVIGLSVEKPVRGNTTVIQEARPVATANDDDDNGGGGTFLQGGELFAGQERARRRVRDTAPPSPGWWLPRLLPDWRAVRQLIMPELPACDSSQRTMWFGRQGPRIVRFPRTADSATPPDTLVLGDAIPLCQPRDIAFGPAGELFVLDGHRRAWDDTIGTPARRSLVVVYDSGAGRDDDPAHVLSIPDALAMAVDSTGQVWTSARESGAMVRVYGPGAKGEAEPVRTIAGGREAGGILGLDVDSRGNSYVISGDEVLVYPPGAKGGDPPVRKLAGPDTFLRRPGDLAIGPGDSLHVLNAFGYWSRCGPMAPAEVTVSVYPPGAEGNVEPARLIVVTQGRKTLGSSFTLRGPTGLAVDRTGAVYVSFDMPGSIAEFAPGAKGMVSPVRVLRMEATGVDPRALAIGKDGAVYVVGYPGPVIC